MVRLRLLRREGVEGGCRIGRVAVVIGVSPVGVGVEGQHGEGRPKVHHVTAQIAIVRPEVRIRYLMQICDVIVVHTVAT